MKISGIVAYIDVIEFLKPRNWREPVTQPHNIDNNVYRYTSQAGIKHSDLKFPLVASNEKERSSGVGLRDEKLLT